MERKVTKNVKINEVYFDASLYPRVQSNWQTVYDYQQSIIAGAIFPPITLAVYNKRLCLVDGKHRLEAYKQLKIKTTKAEVYTGWNKKKIFEEAIKKNIIHGKVFSPFEKRRIALQLRNLKYSDVQIGDLIQVPVGKLEDFIGERLVNTITGELVVKSELKHLAGTSVEENIISTQKPMYSGNQVAMLKELIRLLDKNLIDTDNEKVSKLLNKLKGLLRRF